MYKKMLVALDGSQISEGVLPYARYFSKALKIPVELMHVTDPEVFRFVPASSHAESQAEITRTSTDYLKAVAATFWNPALVSLSVEVGNPAEVIVDKATTDPGILITMATHGRSGLKRWLLGSVAHKVASIATNPLLLVRPSERIKTSGEAELKKVLVPLDGSDLAEMALPHATEVATELLLEVVLVRVYDPLSYGQWQRLDQIAEERRAEAEAYLKEKARRLETQGVEQATYSVLKGYPAAEIVDLVQKMPDSLIAMTTHGRSGVKRWLLGSVTEHVIRHAAGPVLIIRAP